MDNNIDIRLEALRIAEGDVELARTYVDFILGTERKGFIERMREEEAKRTAAERAKRRLNAQFGKLADEPVKFDPSVPSGTTDRIFDILLNDLNRNTLFGRFARSYIDTDSITTEEAPKVEPGNVTPDSATGPTFLGEPLSTGAIMQLNSVYGKTPKDPNSGWCVRCDEMHKGEQWDLLAMIYGQSFVRDTRVPNTAA